MGSSDFSAGNADRSQIILGPWPDRSCNLTFEFLFQISRARHNYRITRFLSLGPWPVRAAWRSQSPHHQNKHRDRSSCEGQGVDATFPNYTTTQLAPVLLHEFKAIAVPFFRKKAIAPFR
ncbi:MAG: hypothetical protein GDA56_18010 [Hormoscilla sp. GM7CHS1pb]|nr:hypothetical protein [Hormoscilla sp. GM7CHS1pb]